MSVDSVIDPALLAIKVLLNVEDTLLSTRQDLLTSVKLIANSEGCDDQNTIIAALQYLMEVQQLD